MDAFMMMPGRTMMDVFMGTCASSLNVCTCVSSMSVQTHSPRKKTVTCVYTSPDVRNRE